MDDLISLCYLQEALDRVEWELENVQNLAKRVLGVRPEAAEALEQFNLKRRGLRPVVKVRQDELAQFLL